MNKLNSVHITLSHSVVLLANGTLKINYMKLQKFGAKSATADSCFGLIGPRQCSAALDGLATSTEDLRHQGALNKPGVLKHSCVHVLQIYM